MKKTEWDDRMDGIIRLLSPEAGTDRLTVQEVADRLSMSTGSVYNRARELGAWKTRKELRITGFDPPDTTDRRTRADRQKVFREITPLAALLEHDPGRNRPSPQCCFLISDEKPYRYCDKPSVPRKSLCAEHCRIVWRAPTEYEEKLLKDKK